MAATGQLSSTLPSSVKQLSDSGAFSAFHLHYYATRDPSSSDDGAADPADPAIREQIPIIDLSQLTHGTLQDRADMVRRLGRACEDWGFFMVVNHGVPETLREAVLGAATAFFEMGEEEKAEESGKHVLDPIRYGTSFNSNIEEDVRYWRDYLKLVVHPEFHCPAKPTRFREVLAEYAACTRKVGMELLKAIWESLGLEESWMSQTLNLDSCFQIFAANLYPPCPHPAIAVGLPQHSDHGLLTLLHQNGVDGLHVEHGGRWVDVKPLSGAFLVNTGDHMQIVTNARYKSVLHRAMTNRERTRVSVVSVVAPSLDTVVQPVEPLVSSERPAVYRGMRYGDFLEYQQGSKLREKFVLDLLRIS